jgi:hypothetical protein
MQTAIELFFPSFPFLFFEAFKKYLSRDCGGGKVSVHLICTVGEQRVAPLGDGRGFPSSLPGSVSRETQTTCLLYILIFLLLQKLIAHTRSCYPSLCASRNVSSCYVLLSFFMDIIATKLLYTRLTFSPLYGPQEPRRWSIFIPVHVDRFSFLLVHIVLFDICTYSFISITVRRRTIP